jgi:hypothetical protein
MRRRVLALVVAASAAGLCLAASPARAGDARTRAVLAHLTAQTRALVREDADGFRATLTADARVAFDTAEPTRDAADERVMWTFPPLKKIVVGRTRIGWAGDWGWVAAELRVTTQMWAEPEGAGDPHPKPETRTYNWLAVVVPDGKGFKTRALFVSKEQPDKDLISDRSPPALSKTPGELAPLLARPPALAAQLAANPGVVVLGTSAGERGLGRAAARRLLDRWKHLDLVQVGATYEVVHGDLGFAFAEVAMKTRANKDRFDLDAFVVAHRTQAGWEIVAVAYGPP